MKMWLLLLCLSLVACKAKKLSDREIIADWIGKEIVFPDMELKIGGKDTLCPGMMEKKFKVFSYIDTTGCMSCKLKLYDWQKYIEDVKAISDDVAFIFVVTSKDYDEFERQQDTNHFHHPVYYDPRAQLDSLNHLPEDFLFQCFLLDKDNRVLGIGNPVLMSSIRRLYEKVITGKI